jgi:5-enolpyruvylshikimate-3-phosphate synthase
MALAVAALAADGDSEVEDGECVSISFPEFPAILAEATS